MIGSFVRLPEGFPELPVAGHIALVIDREGDDWVLELNRNPVPREYGENAMYWPIADSDELEVITL